MKIVTYLEDVYLLVNNPFYLNNFDYIPTSIEFDTIEEALLAQKEYNARIPPYYPHQCTITGKTISYRLQNNNPEAFMIESIS